MTTGRKEKSAAATAALAGNNGFSLISNEKLLQLYSSLVKCRMIEERVRLLSECRGLVGSGNAFAGREAGAVGVAIDLLPEDVVVSSPGDFIVNLIRGDSLSRVVHSFLASSADPAPANCFSNLIKTAMSAALAAKTGKKGRIAVVFGNEESSSSAIWRKALKNAGTDCLPMIFVHYSGHANGPAKGDAQSMLEKIGLRTQEHGIPVIHVDGSDLVAIYRVATESIAHARKGNGASLIHCVTLHSESRAETDSILKMEAYLSRKGLFSEELKREVAGGIGKELDAAIEVAGSSSISN
jgi:TPP-dependent pyruvate/acetoin dehydrogenase alpha subunit